MSAAVHRYARAPHMAALSNALDLALASAKCQAWFEWVLSLANCAVEASRRSSRGLVTPTPAPFTTGLKFPSFETTETFRAATTARLPR